MLSLLAVVPPAILPAQADPRVGNWTLLSSQSSLTPPNRLSITPAHGGLHVVMSGETHFDFTTNKNARQSAAPGNFGFNQIELRRIDKRQSVVTEKKDGAPVATVHEQLSKDGNELTSTTSSPQSSPKSSSVRADKTTVWVRSGGAKVAGDLFVGDWTEDLSKTRLRQGLALKIEADGRGGVRFLGGYSYDARFDGKQYDVQNGRNDTVTLQLVDPHTVDAIFRRDDQVTQQDRWVVSADGRQMTLSSAGTLETGQRISEKLVFRKQ